MGDGYSLRAYGKAILTLCNPLGRKALEDKAEKIRREMAGKSREEIRTRIVEGRSAHAVAKCIILDAKNHPGDWKLAARTQLAAIYKLSEADAGAIVSEMS